MLLSQSAAVSQFIYPDLMTLLSQFAYAWLPASLMAGRG